MTTDESPASPPPTRRPPRRPGGCIESPPSPPAWPWPSSRSAAAWPPPRRHQRSAQRTSRRRAGSSACRSRCCAGSTPAMGTSSPTPPSRTTTPNRGGARSGCTSCAYPRAIRSTRSAPCSSTSADPAPQPPPQSAPSAGTCSTRRSWPVTTWSGSIRANRAEPARTLCAGRPGPTVSVRDRRPFPGHTRAEPRGSSAGAPLRSGVQGPQRRPARPCRNAAVRSRPARVAGRDGRPSDQPARPVVRHVPRPSRGEHLPQPHPRLDPRRRSRSCVGQWAGQLGQLDQGERRPGQLGDDGSVLPVVRPGRALPLRLRRRQPRTQVRHPRPPAAGRATAGSPRGRHRVLTRLRRADQWTLVEQRAVRELSGGPGWPSRSRPRTCRTCRRSPA